MSSLLKSYKNQITLIFLAICLVLLSYRGGSTRIKVIANGTLIETYVDDSLISSFNDDTFRSGSIQVGLESSGALATRVNPAVTQVLLNTGPGSTNLLSPQYFPAKITEPVKQIYTGNWQDFTLEVTCQACASINLKIRAPNAESGYQFTLRPWHHLDHGWQKIITGRNEEVQYNKREPLRLSLLEISRNIISDLLPSLLLFISCLLVAEGLSQKFGLTIKQTQLNSSISKSEFSFILTVSCLAFFLLYFITQYYYQGIPHVQDSSAYWFQSNIFSKGWLYALSPPTPEHWEFEFIFVHEGRWFSLYPFVWPAALALGQFIGQPQIIPALIGVLNLVLVWCVARENFGKSAAFWAAILMFFSPWFQMMSSNFMSHNMSCSFSILTFMFYMRMQKNLNNLSAFSFGLFLGILFNTRPMTAFCLGLPLAIHALIIIFKLNWKPLLKPYIASIFGFALPMLLFLTYNHLAMGGMLHSPYELQRGATTKGLQFFLEMLGIFKDAAISQAIAHYQSQLALYHQIALPVPSDLFLFFFILAIYYSSTTSILALCCMLSVTLIYSFFPNVVWSVMWGPRYWYETLPLLVIVSAKGIQIFIQTISVLTKRIKFAAQLATICLLALIFYHQYEWSLVFGGRDMFDPNTPIQMRALRGFNYVNGNLAQQIMKISEPAIVFLPNEMHWHSYGHGFFLNDPDLENSKVWIVRDLGDKRNAELVYHAPHRKLFKGYPIDATIRTYALNSADGP